MMRMFVLAGLCMLVLTACDRRGFTPSGVEAGVPQTRPIPRTGPDEFMVIEQGSLQRPSDLGAALPVPEPGVPSRVVPNPEQTAQELFAGLGGQPVRPGDGAALKDILGIGDTDPALRAIITQEHQALMDPRDTLYSRLYGRPLFNPYRFDRLDLVDEPARLRAQYPDAAIPVMPDES